MSYDRRWNVTHNAQRISVQIIREATRFAADQSFYDQTGPILPDRDLIVDGCWAERP